MRRLFVPEVVQTSAMDCGPASLKALLEGFGIRASYGRLREACFTGLDGTSIDQIEDAAVRLGLDAEQIMLPVDHLLLEESAALPALVVIRLASGATHFVDPGTGRQWRTRREFLAEVYVHSQRVPADAWREWAGSPDFLKPLEHRLRKLRLGALDRQTLIASALLDTTPQTLAALDAATRLVESLAAEQAVDRRPAVVDLLRGLMQRPHTIPEAWWSARVDPADGDQIALRGAVLMRVKGVRAATDRDPSALSPEFADALTERARPPLVALWKTLCADGLRFPVALAAALALAAAGVVAEAVFFRGLFDLARLLAVGSQRWLALGALALFFGAVTLLEIAVSHAIVRSGRRFEGLLRLEFLTKIPRLADAYFRSRLMSDMAERAHSAHRLRDLPSLVAGLARVACGLIFTVLGIACLYPESWAPAVAAAIAAVAVPLMAQPWLAERDLRVRSHAGALGRFFLDALLGLTAVRAHGAGRAIRREHESLLAEWGRASLIAGRSAVAVQSLQAAVCALTVIWLLLARFAAHGDAGGLLLIYWALSIPAFGQELATLACQYPRLRNTLLRVTEPLGAREEKAISQEPSSAPPGHGVAITMNHVSVSTGGHARIEDLNLRIWPGEHVAIVGTSGAGKSSLAGLLLGWNKPTGGELRVDGGILDAGGLTELRRSTAWLSPDVQLWNRSLLDNLRYGVGDDGAAAGAVLEAAELIPVIEKLPDGMQTTLGEGGRLLSGGEGQRVRFGRGLQRPGVRLAILDEAFRGLERGRRRMLLDSARHRWAHATLLNITHDINDTKNFDRVLVMDGGRIVEDGSPKELSRHAGSRYRALLDAEKAVRERVWSDGDWRTFRLDEGRLRREEPVARCQEALC
jgi:ABC-type bacteriocin/lantibiotic exporter with double-glycine peptidase domain